MSEELASMPRAKSPRSAAARPAPARSRAKDHNGDRADPPEERGLVSRIGPVEVDWPRSLGYFGAAAAAVALEIVEPPLGLFIAAVPFLKMLLSRSDSAKPVRFVGQIIEGASKPVGGDSEGTVRYESARGTSEE